MLGAVEWIPVPAAMLVFTLITPHFCAFSVSCVLQQQQNDKVGYAYRGVGVHSCSFFFFVSLSSLSFPVLYLLFFSLFLFFFFLFSN